MSARCLPQVDKLIIQQESHETLTTIIPFSGPSFAAISSTKMSFAIFSPPQYEARYHSTGHRIMDILVNEEKEELILVSCSGPRQQLTVYRVPMDRLDTLDSTNLGNGIGTGLTSEAHSQTVSCLYRTAEGLACGIQIANIRADEKEGLLSVIHFD